MTDKDIKVFIRKCKWHATKKGFQNDADDFAQEAVMKTIAGRKASIPQLFIDYLRFHYADPRTSIYKLKINAKLHSLNIHVENKGSIAGLTITQNIPEEITFKDLDEGYKSYLTNKELKTLDLYLQGYLTKEIALKLEYSESRASQIMENVIVKIKDYLDYKDGKTKTMAFKKLR